MKQALLALNSLSFYVFQYKKQYKVFQAINIYAPDPLACLQALAVMHPETLCRAGF